MNGVSPAGRCVASVVIEWENIGLADSDRCVAMLGELGRQIADFPGRPTGGARDFEILVIFDDTKIAEGDVRRFVTRSIPDAPERADIRFIAGEGRDYYEQKNLGAGLARGLFVVFLDSDVIPEPGWLWNLLRSFSSPRVDVVCGNCYLEASDLVSRAFALGWFFPLRDGREVLYRQDSFFANNVAFRQDVATVYPFEPLPGTSRGACRLLARRLTAEGRGLFINSAARVRHPAPNGLRHLILRGLSQGRDNLLFHRAIGGGSVAESVQRVMRLQRRAWTRILGHGRKVGLGILGVPAALLIMSGHYCCYALGDVAARIAPGWAERHLQV